jgi:hypothetical protein
MQTIALLIVFSFSSWAMASSLTGARIIPSGKVAIYDGAKKIGELSSEAPLPDGKLLVSDEKCGVKLEDIYLVATEKTKFSVTAIAGGQDVFVQEGVVHFALGAFKSTLTFSTPQDTVTVRDVVINASTSTPVVIGYLSFQDNKMDIVVLEGGKLMVVNSRGQQLIETGNGARIQKAQAFLGAGGVGAALGEGASGFVITGGMLAAKAGFVAAVMNQNDSNQPTSPFQP